MGGQEQGGKQMRNARIFLAVLGGIFVAIALWLGASEPGRDYRVTVCALIGAFLLGVARFAPDRWVRRIETLLTGWP